LTSLIRITNIFGVVLELAICLALAFFCIIFWRVSFTGMRTEILNLDCHCYWFGKFFVIERFFKAIAWRIGAWDQIKFFLIILRYANFDDHPKIYPIKLFVIKYVSVLFKTVDRSVPHQPHAGLGTLFFLPFLQDLCRSFFGLNL